MIQEFKQIIKPIIFILFLALFIGTVSTLSSISLMGLSAWLIASAALQPPLYVLSLAIVGVRFCGIMRAVFRYLERYLTHNVGFSLFTNFRTIILNKIIEALPFQRQTAKGDAFELIINAVDKLRDNCLRFFFPPFIVSFCIIIVVIWVSWYEFNFSLLLLSAWVIFMLILPYGAWNFYCKIVKIKFKLAEEIMEFYEGNTELIVYDYVITRLEKINLAIDEYQKYHQKLFKLKLKISLISEIVMGLYITLCLALAVYLVLEQGFNPIMAITILLVFQAILEAVSIIPLLVEYIYEANECWQDLRLFIHKKTVIGETNSIEHEQNVLSLKNVAYGYKEILLKNVDISLLKGQKTLIIGPSGCGKSTLFYVLTRLLYPIQGHLGVNGQDYNSLDDDEIREYFAVSFQDHHIFNLSIRDNFKILYKDISDEEIYEALRKVYLIDFVNKVGLDYILINDGANLSGGQKHRLQLAMCLARQKEIILLDEPTAGLDIKTSKDLCAQIMENYKEQTMLVSSHDISLLNYFDNIIICEAGKIIEQGKIKILLARSNSYLNKLIKYKNLV